MSSSLRPTASQHMPLARKVGKRLRLARKRLTAAIKAPYYLVADALEVALGRRDPLVPPRRFVVGDFAQVGDEFFGYFRSLCGLKPEDRVLDVGCGIGRMARPLTGYLSKGGSYEGFDIIPAEISWCRKSISRRYPNFRFQVVDIFNDAYNPRGRQRATDFRFPYQEGWFDLVYLTSVFTHTLPADVQNYLGEVARVLKLDGKCLITYFLLNDESRRLLEKGSSTLDFRFRGDGFLTTSEKTPEQAIAYDETAIRNLYPEKGLRILDPIHYGSWCGREAGMSYQDIVVAERVPAGAQ